MSAEPRTEPRAKTPLHIPNVWVKTLFIYYFFIFAGGNLTAIAVVLPILDLQGGPTAYSFALIGSFGMACSGSSIFYIRKLYKSCITSDFIDSNEQGDSLRRLGAIIYYFARPLFAISFSLLTVVGFKVGLVVISAESIELNYNFTYVAMFTSFFIGFSTGKFIRQLEDRSSSIIGKLEY